MAARFTAPVAMADHEPDDSDAQTPILSRDASLFLNSMSCLGEAHGEDPLSVYMAPR